jgi:quercetin dioxygenase-like cupin family protein
MILSDLKHVDMKRVAKIYLSIAILCSTVLFSNCSADNTGASMRDGQIFPKGELGSEKHFTGKAYNFGLVPSDSIYNMLVGNVYFEAGARSNWHTHPGGQILIITDGEGYHQIEGEPKQRMKKGDVIQCPPDAKHWHGATASTSLSQLYIVPDTGNGIVTWLEPVTDEQYNSNK